MNDGIAKRIAAALKNGPVSRRELLQDRFNFEIPGPALDEAFDVLIKNGKARRFTNWPMYGGDVVEYWTLTLTATKPE